MPKKKKNDFSYSEDEDSVNLSFGPFNIKRKIQQPSNPQDEMIKRKLLLERQKIVNEYYLMREQKIRLEERLNFYRKIVRELNNRLDTVVSVPADKKQDAVDNIKKWVSDITKDDNL
jgi:hypothetical protein